MNRVLTLFVLSALAFPLTSRGEEPIKPDQPKPPEGVAAELEKKKDAPPAVKISDAARPVVDKMREAYGKLAGLQMKGTWKVEFEVGAEKDTESAEFTASFAAPNKFRHETKGDLLFGSTGEKSFMLSKNQYLMGDATKARVAVADLPKLWGDLLQVKNPSLLLAVTDEPTPYLAAEATSIDKAADVTIDGKTFTQLKVDTQHKADITVLVDGATGLMRQWSVDLKRSMTERGQPDVKTATMICDYTEVKPESPGPETFAWSPPEGAKDAAKMASAGAGDAEKLVGVAAPPFELKDLNDKVVKLEDLKGSVVVLDFWATWCGPCVVGLPILDTATQARKDKPLKVFAINLEEDKKDVAAFVAEKKLGLSVLLDPTGDTGRAYHANAIPETVIIGKDGIVRKVMVGVHPKEELEAAIDQALK